MIRHEAPLRMMGSLIGIIISLAACVSPLALGRAYTFRTPDRWIVMNRDDRSAWKRMGVDVDAETENVFQTVVKEANILLQRGKESTLSLIMGVPAERGGFYHFLRFVNLDTPREIVGDEKRQLIQAVYPQGHDLEPEVYENTSVRVASFGKNMFLFFSAPPLDSLSERLKAHAQRRVLFSIAISFRGGYYHPFAAYLSDSEAARGFEEFLASLEFR